MSASSSGRTGGIVADGVHFALPDGRVLFRDLSVAFGRERSGLIGPNGSGKTMLLRLLAGGVVPSAGTVHRVGNVAVLPQEFRPPPHEPLHQVLRIGERLAVVQRALDGNATAAEVAAVGDDWNLAERAAQVLSRYGLGHLRLDRPVGTVSGGEATRVALAGLSLDRAEVLLLDEPTNHLDAASRATLYQFVSEWTGTLVCVSHDRALLNLMSRIVELSAFGVRVYGGNYDAYRERRDADDAAAVRELESARADLRTAERSAREVRERQARRDARGKRGRETANMPKILLNNRKQSAQETTARVRAVTEREVEERQRRVDDARRLVEERARPRFMIEPTGLPAGRTVLALEGVTVQFAAGVPPVLDDVSLRLVGPERVAVVGPNGSGKSTLLAAAMGRIAPSDGSVRRLGSGEIAHLDQLGTALDANRSVLDNYRAYHPQATVKVARYALARFLFSGDAALQLVATLSGGERLRASLACVLGGEDPPALLLLDEPTNHLDLDATEALEEALRAYDGAILVVSHDEDFLRSIGVTRRVVLEAGALADPSG